MSVRRPALRPRPSAVRIRAGGRPRGERAGPREPGLVLRLWAGVCTSQFWWWCAAKLAALGVLVVSVTLLYHVLSGAEYYVTEVAVQGNRLLRPQEVVDMAAVSGGHILWLDSRQAAQRLRGLPAVQDAEVQFSFPNRARVVVAEREPVAVWQVSGGSYLIDREGRVIGLAGRDAPGLTVREGRGGVLQLGDRVPAEAVAAAEALQDLLPATWQPVTGVFDYSADVGINIATRNGWRVRFGDNEAVPVKVATFLALAAEIDQTGARAQLVDVRFPGRPYYR